MPDMIQKQNAQHKNSDT